MFPCAGLARGRGKGRAVRVLLVEDDRRVSSVLATVLVKHGYDVMVRATGAQALAEPIDDFDVVLVDIGLPGMDGYSVCDAIRQRSDVPIVITTARSDVREKIKGLSIGADDYLVKPYDYRELLARIDSVCRRSRRVPSQATRHSAIGELRIDIAARTVTVGDEVIRLTRKEFDILALLARHPGVVVRRERIAGEVWQTTWQGIGRSLEVHVASLRSKLGRPELIGTVRGVGYRLTAG